MPPLALFRYGDSGPTSYHAYEGALPTELDTAIATLAPALWGRFQDFGYSAGLDCTRVAPVWAQALQDVGVPTLLLEGDYLFESPVQPDGHEWLALGEGLWIFDPTWWQFRRMGPARLERYLLAGTLFASWRQTRLGGG